MVEMSKCLLLNLVARIQKGDMQDFPIIYRNYEKLIDYYSKKLDDEDAFQELTVFFLELLYEIDLCRFAKISEEGLKRYIAVCLRNQYISLSKKREKAQKMASILLQYDELCTDFEDDRLIVKDLLEKLSIKQRVVIAYRYIYNYSDNEIAAALNISRQAVCKLRNRAINNLREHL